jgi:hypothetical protein
MRCSVAIVHATATSRRDNSRLFCSGAVTLRSDWSAMDAGAVVIVGSVPIGVCVDGSPITVQERANEKFHHSGGVGKFPSFNDASKCSELDIPCL